MLEFGIHVAKPGVPDAISPIARKVFMFISQSRVVNWMMKTLTEWLVFGVTLLWTQTSFIKLGWETI
jgi:hypothetical protein